MLEFAWALLDDFELGLGESEHFLCVIFLVFDEFFDANYEIYISVNSIVRDSLFKNCIEY